MPTLTIDGSTIAKRHASNLRFDYGAYKRMAALKVMFYTRILKRGFNVWACDADTAWMGNPAAFVSEYPMGFADILTTTDCIDVDGDVKNGCWHVDHNTGLVFMRSRPVVLEFLEAWKNKIQTTRDVMIRDQAALNLLMREGFRSRVWKPPPDPEGGQEVRARSARGRGGGRAQGRAGAGPHRPSPPSRRCVRSIWRGTTASRSRASRSNTSPTATRSSFSACTRARTHRRRSRFT